MSKYKSITLVQDGLAVRDPKEALETAKWWVLCVLGGAEYPMWCVYGGSGPAVFRCLKQHTECHDATAVVAYPFDDVQASLKARADLEVHYRNLRADACLA